MTVANGAVTAPITPAGGDQAGPTDARRNPTADSHSRRRGLGAWGCLVGLAVAIVCGVAVCAVAGPATWSLTGFLSGLAVALVFEVFDLRRRVSDLEREVTRLRGW